MARKLRLYVEWGFTGVSEEEEDVDLPENWDEMTEDEQEAHIKECLETIVYNQVSTHGEVVEVDE